MKSHLAIGVCLSLGLIVQAHDRYVGKANRSAPAIQDDREKAARIYQEVFKKPFDQEAIKAYLGLLPRDGDYFVVEGDLLMTEQELRAYIIDKSMGERIAKRDSTELLVNKYGGKRDYYRDPSTRTLTYAVDRQSFATAEQHTLVVNSMRRAGTDWENACPSCGVRFVHQAQFDNSPSSNTNVNFTVRWHDTGGEYIAVAFYPHDDSTRRYVNIDPSYFAPEAKSLAVGVLRHELGHVLGYRHEHLSDSAPGCFKEKVNENDHQWAALTPYDSKSVMHYFCGPNEDRKNNPTLAISETDRVGHRELYNLINGQPPAGASSSGPSGFSLAVPSSAGSDSKARTLTIHQNVLRNPFDQEAIKAYMSSLPTDGDYFVVEGDMLMTEQELRAYVITKSQGPTLADPDSSELIVNVDAGNRDYYRDPSKRTLTYAIDRKSFAAPEQYTLVVNSMRQAGRDWANACPRCGVRFVHQAQFDSSPSPGKVNFAVRSHDAAGRYVAAAFFPHDDSSRRYLNIDPSYFRTDLQPLAVGILRHELGHVLGYRHEHTRDIAGCYSEDRQWQPLTDYDSQSVMHYFCGGGGNAKLELSKLDRAGHTKLYNNFNSPSLGYLIDAEQGPELVVHFEGGDLQENAARVLSALTDLNLVPLGTHRVAPGESLKEIYTERLRFPYFSPSMAQLADNLNKTQLTPHDLKPGKRIIYPAVDFTDYGFKLHLDPESRNDQSRLAALRQDFAALIQKEEQTSSGLVTLTLKGYELRLQVDTTETLAKAKARLNTLKLSPADVVIIATDKNEQLRRNLFFTDDTPPLTESIEEFWAQSTVTHKGKVPKNLQGDLAYSASAGRAAVEDYRARLKPCTRGAACPDVVLIDQPIDRHPDIASAVIGGNETQGAKELLRDDIQVIEEGSYDSNNDHGTYMAGIIASQDNTFGLIGMDPYARITPLLWTTSTTLSSDQGQKLVQEIQKRDNQGGVQIFVFASDFSYEDLSLSVRDRIDSNTMARKIKNLEGFLWIVAAGQLPSGRGDDIKEDYKSGPMNLGSRPNVLVVTGYSTSADGSLHLLPEANFSSEGLVHIAGPGREVMSTVRISKYVKEHGTSPATAFVAGVASAMANTWDYYNRADKIKFRLQLTATPLVDEGNPRKIAQVILNPALAMYDPKKEWLQVIKQDLQEVTPTCWNLQTISVRDPITNTSVHGGSLSIDLIRRIYRIPNSNPAQWVIYYVEPDPDRSNEAKKGLVKRIGPVRIVEESSTIFTTNLGLRPLSTIKDLILTEGTQYPVCPP